MSTIFLESSLEFIGKSLPFLFSCFHNIYALETSFSMWFYEGGLKSSRPSLPETRDKRPLGRESDRSWCHRHTTSMMKLFGSSPWLHGHRGQHTGKVKSSRPSLQRTNIGKRKLFKFLTGQEKHQLLFLD